LGQLARLQFGFMGGPALLPVAEQNADDGHDQGRGEGHGAKTEAEPHYNEASTFRRSTMKIFVAIAFVLILASLGSALFFLMRDKGRSNRTVNALALRVGLSIVLFLCLLAAHQLGWIAPTGLR